MPLKTNEREYRSIQIPLMIPNQEEEKRFETDQYVEGMATTFDDPYLLGENDGIEYYEVINRNALEGADVSDVIMQYNHQGKVLARQSNNTLGIEPTEKGLFIFADLSKSRAAKDLYEEITNGLITKMSWAFTVGEDSYDKETRTRTITRIKKVYDISAVAYPANSGTEISARSFVDGVIDMEQQELLKRKTLIAKFIYETERSR